MLSALRPSASALRLLAALTLSLLAILTGASTSAGAGDYKRCSDVFIYQNGQLYTRTNGLFQKHTTCRVARRVARKYLSGSEGSEQAPHPYGYRCSGGEDGVACRKGRKRITWGYYYD